MKKIININLSGRVIPIEDAAYEKLQAYIESLRRYFASEEGRDEIINDIESRIAELMNDKVRKGADCVTEADLEEIIQSIGRPQDFAADDATDSAGSATGADTGAAYTGPRKKSRLYRDSSDKFIGGVCSGLAAYLNVDPAIVRILFAIITFGGFGLGFLIYILLWIVLPSSDLDGYRGKRLFRNPDDKILGGVAGGLGAYFNKDAKMIRLIFIAPLLISMLLSILGGFGNYDFDVFPNLVFGSLNGTLFLIYVVLWIVLPEARGPYERMEMRGESVDLNSIRQNVKDRGENVKERFKEWGQEVKESADNFSRKATDFANTRGRTFATEVGESARRGGQGIGHAIGVLFRVFFLIVAGTIAFGLFVGLIAIIFGGVAWWPVNNFLWTSTWQQMYAWGTLIFFLLVPLVAFLTWIVRRMLKVRSKNNYLGWTFGFLWTLGWVCAILLGSTLSRDFRQQESLQTTVEVNQPARGKMVVAVTQPGLTYTGNYGWINDDWDGWDVNEDSAHLSAVELGVEKSADSQYHVLVIRHSNGRDRQDARARAEKISYTVNSVDSLLDLPNGFGIHKDSKYRGQQVEVVIFVPVGKQLRFDYSVVEKLNFVRINWRKDRGRGWNRNFGRNDHWDVTSDFPWSSDIDYTMGADGELHDPAGRSVGTPAVPSRSGNDYRYQDEQIEQQRDIDERIREEKRKQEESDRLIRQLEEEKKQQRRDTVKESMNDEEAGTTTASRSTIFSVMSWL